MAAFLNIGLTVIVTILVFGVLIFIHELGHYIAARKCGVGIYEFAIGMGPKIKTWKGKYNDFSIRALPIGGFVSMVGEDSEEVLEGHEGKESLYSKKLWQRVIVTLAGPLMNIILGFLIMAVIVSTSPALASNTIAVFNENSVSDQTGLEVGDEIIKVNGKRMRTINDLSFTVGFDGREPVDVTVIRNGEEVLVKDVSFPVDTQDGIALGSIDFKVKALEKNFVNIASQSFYQPWSYVKMTVKSLYYVVKGEFGFNAVSGPIGVGEQMGTVIKESNGFANTVRNIGIMAVLLSMSLGIFNLLPIPVLDGGHLLYYLIEAIRRKPVSLKVQQTLNGICMILLFALMAVVALKDIWNLF